MLELSDIVSFLLKGYFIKKIVENWWLLMLTTTVVSMMCSQSSGGFEELYNLEGFPL